MRRGLGAVVVELVEVLVFLGDRSFSILAGGPPTSATYVSVMSTDHGGDGMERGTNNIAEKEKKEKGSCEWRH
jgi:hypothetical protein